MKYDIWDRIVLTLLRVIVPPVVREVVRKLTKPKIKRKRAAENIAPNTQQPKLYAFQPLHMPIIVIAMASNLVTWLVSIQSLPSRSFALLAGLGAASVAGALIHKIVEMRTNRDFLVQALRQELAALKPPMPVLIGPDKGPKRKPSVRTTGATPQSEVEARQDTVSPKESKAGVPRRPNVPSRPKKKSRRAKTTTRRRNPNS
jgi:hypothetical protein